MCVYNRSRLTVIKGQITGFNDREDGVYDFYVRTAKGETYTLSSLGYAEKDVQLDGTEYIAARPSNKPPRMLFRDEIVYFTLRMFRVEGITHKIPGWVTSEDWRTLIIYVSRERATPINSIIFSKGSER